MTKYEIEILRIISESNEHLTADEVYERVKIKYPSMVKASSYNNLNKLTSAGLIRRIVTDSGADRFDKTIRHDHLVCRRCGALKDVFLPDISHYLENDLEESIDSYDLKMYWVCPKCRESN